MNKMRRDYMLNFENTARYSPKVTYFYMFNLVGYLKSFKSFLFLLF